MKTTYCFGRHVLQRQIALGATRLIVMNVQDLLQCIPLEPFGKLWCVERACRAAFLYWAFPCRMNLTRSDLLITDERPDVSLV